MWTHCRKPITAAYLIGELADTIPGFQDSALFTPPAAAAGVAAADAGSSDGAGGSNGGPGGSSGSIKVVYLRKAQALAAELGLRFGGEDPRFAFTDREQLAADSGGCCQGFLSPVVQAVVCGNGLMSGDSRSLQAREEVEDCADPTSA